MLAGRLVATAEWLSSQPETKSLEIGLFGASTGGGAALVAAAQRPELIHAVVWRGGRPDLAGEALRFVQAPPLLIVAGRGIPVTRLSPGPYQQIPPIPHPALRLAPHLLSH